MFGEYQDSDLFLVTTNSFVRNDGSLVVGAGAAKQARQEITDDGGYQFLAQGLGGRVKRTCGHLGTYGLLLSEGYPSIRVGIFQVKRHWKTDAKLELIGASAMQLLKWTCKRPDARVDLNYPGIGNGGLDKDRVTPIVQELPDTVRVWTFD
jgi:hypothetical protein